MLVPENSSFALLELVHPKMKIITLPDSLFVKRIKWIHRWRELRRMHGWPRKVVKIPRDIWYHYLPKSYPICKESLLKYLVCLHTPILVYVLSMKPSLHTQSCPTLCDPTDCSLPGSSVNGRKTWGQSASDSAQSYYHRAGSAVRTVLLHKAPQTALCHLSYSTWNGSLGPEKGALASSNKVTSSTKEFTFQGLLEI